MNFVFIQISVFYFFSYYQTDFLVPDFSAFKPHFNVTSVEEYLISWDDPDIQSLYTSHILNLSIPQVLQKDTTYAIQVMWKSVD